MVLAEKEIREEDLDRVPIVLKNAPYFKPFELFTSLLPLPAYTSYDPTPFIGIFFPLFFGMILGDAGYGFSSLPVSTMLMRKFRQQGMCPGRRPDPADRIVVYDLLRCSLR